jgi:hypothetical protein
VNAVGAKVARLYSSSPDEVFEAAKRASASLGYELVHVDATRRTLSFETASSTTALDRREVTVCVDPDGSRSGSHVIVTEGEPASALAARGRLEWAANVPNRFIKALTETLLRPSAGWLADPSGRFAQRWWDGCAWTSRARDYEGGPQYEDQPGDLVAPSSKTTSTDSQQNRTPTCRIA